MEYRVDFDREEVGRSIAEIERLPGVPGYGVSQAEARQRVRAFALEQEPESRWNEDRGPHNGSE